MEGMAQGPRSPQHTETSHPPAQGTETIYRGPSNLITSHTGNNYVVPQDLMQDLLGHKGLSLRLYLDISTSPISHNTPHCPRQPNPTVYSTAEPRQC